MARLLTIKQVVDQASLELGIAMRPTTQAVGSVDQDVVQMVSLMQAVADEVLLDEPYRTQLGDGIWLTDKAGVPLTEPGDDTDLVLFDGRLAVDGLKWRFLKAKGLEFGEEMRDFTQRISKLAGLANARVLDLDVDEERAI